MPRRFLTFNGRTQALAAWAREFGLPATTVATRLRRGIPLGVALTMGPVHEEVWIVYGGARRRLADVCRETGVPCAVAACRVARGMDPARAVETPVRPRSAPLTCWGEAKTIAAWLRDRRVRPRRLNARTIRTRLRRGWTAEAALTTPPTRRPQLVTYRGRVVRVADLARQLGVSYAALRRRIAAGKPEEAWGEPVTRWRDPRHRRRSGGQVLIEAARAGTLHPSVRLRFRPYRVQHHGRWVPLTGLCARHGVALATVTGVLGRGGTLAAALATPRHEARIEHEGMTRTWSEWADVTGIAVGTLRARARAGWPVARVLTTPAAPPAFAYVTYRGERRRLRDLAREKKVAVDTLRRRLRRGVTAEEALDG